jgi:arylsulfatase A-like enzyme
MDPHDVYQPHPESPDFGKKSRDKYDSEVFYTDLWIGKLLDWIDQQPWAKDTAIIVSSDHGEAFGEHKLYRHAFELYDVLVHVPMFVVIPGQAPRTIDVHRSHLDLVPTMFELMGIKPNPELRGQSFVNELWGAEAEQRDVGCDLPEDSHNERRRAFIHDGWKIIAFANDFRFELYNLKDDPGELKDLFKTEKDRAKDMVDRYKAFSKTISDVKIEVTKHKPLERYSRTPAEGRSEMWLSLLRRPRLSSTSRRISSGSIGLSRQRLGTAATKSRARLVNAPPVISTNRSSTPGRARRMASYTSIPAMSGIIRSQRITSNR